MVFALHNINVAILEEKVLCVLSSLKSNQITTITIKGTIKGTIRGTIKGVVHVVFIKI